MTDKPTQSLRDFKVPPDFRGRGLVTVQLWNLVQRTLIALSPRPLHRWRCFWLRVFGAEVGQRVHIRPSVRVTYPWKVKIGNDVWLGDRAELYSLESITVGENVCISQDAYICTGSHDMSRTDFAYKCNPVEIEAGSWIAAGAFVGPGVTVGSGAVLAARSVAMRALEPRMVYAGNPARALRERTPVR
ncbi:MAG: WcaF family extracellular polysaccharide biosynthesis acetyltransferase [Vannielia sp.]|uniref:WcaF family extracellular polysaccharide biosynthesis acetyltransferase n=1 Tax=Vannielia sp. TaxID=2813045 RepID=UPI003B8ADE70